MSDTPTCTQYEMIPERLIEMITAAKAKAEQVIVDVNAKMREVYSYPTVTGMWWWKKKRPATPEEIEQRLRHSKSTWTIEYDHGWRPMFRAQNDIERMDELLAAAKRLSVKTVFLSHDDMNMINRYLP